MPKKPAKPLAKSLHTVSVLTNLARHLMAQDATLSAAAAVRQAVAILKLDGKPDTYSLIEAARNAI